MLDAGFTGKGWFECAAMLDILANIKQTVTIICTFVSL